MYRPDQFYEFSTRMGQLPERGRILTLPPQIPGDRLGTNMLWQLKPVPETEVGLACCETILSSSTSSVAPAGTC